jgi:hypothetical protein
VAHAQAHRAAKQEFGAAGCPRLVVPGAVRSHTALFVRFAKSEKPPSPGSCWRGGVITPDFVVEVDLVVEQLHALFTEKVVSLDSILKIYVSIGMNDDAELRFGERVAVATDRALHSAFVTLRQVV